MGMDNVKIDRINATGTQSQERRSYRRRKSRAGRTA